MTSLKPLSTPFSVLLLAGALAGCGTGVAPSTTTAPLTTTPTTVTQLLEAGTVVVTESGCSFQPSSGQLAAGELSFNAVNETDGQAGVHVWGPIADGYTFDDFVAYIEEEIRLTETGEDFVGPADWFGDLIPRNGDDGLLEIGESKALEGRARGGTYGVVCVKTFEQLGPRVFAYAGPIEVR